jgi:phosphate starvation-inducible PhoH-like protein
MSRPDDPVTLVLTFDDASLAPALCGPQHRHLALIEDAFGVRLESAGGDVTIEGRAGDVAQARIAVEALYERLQRGDAVGVEDVRAGVSFAKKGAGARPQGLALPGRRSLIAPRTPAQASYLEALRSPDADLVFGVGPAGTGKTYLAAAVAVSALLEGQVSRLVVTRPAVEAGERLGFLPGDLNEKVDPYLQPIWDSLRALLGPGQFERRRAAGDIEVAPLAFMRGRTLSDAFVIVDEAQNATKLQMKMVLTRLGEGSRMAVNGDPTQVDLLRPEDSGLAHALGLLDGVKGVRAIRFGTEDVVRHPLVGRIIARYEGERG